MRVNCIDNVRPATPYDAEGIASVMKESWTLAYSGIIPHDSLAAILRKRTAAWWRGILSGSHAVLVSERQGQVVGYASAGANRTRALAGQGEVYEIYVLPVHQGTGVGRTLLEDARSALSGLGLRGCVAWAVDECPSAGEFLEATGGRAAASGFESFGSRRVAKTAYAW